MKRMRTDSRNAINLRTKRVNIKNVIARLMMASFLLLTGCGLNRGGNINDGYSYPDQMFQTEENKVTLYAFRYGDKCIETEHCYEIDVPLDMMPVDGAFYEIVADVTFLDGGIAGFIHMPEIRKIRSCKEISVEELSFSSIESESYGLLELGDYCDGELLLCGQGIKAVYDNGKWIYSYSNYMYIDTNQAVYYNGVITEEQIKAGMENGVICCEDYFVMPQRTY